MDLTFASLFALMQFTLRRPRESAREILGMGLPDAVRWMSFVLVAVGSAIGTHLSIAVLPPDQRAVLETLFDSPIRTALVQGGIWLVITLLVTALGRMRGGQGRFGDALLLVTWLLFILLCVQALQVVVGLVLAPLADLVGVLGLVLLLWLLTNFVAELHGFTSLWSVFLGLVLGAVGLFLGAAVVLAMLIGAPAPGV
jgi:hypothetical protein